MLQRTLSNVLMEHERLYHQDPLDSIRKGSSFSNESKQSDISKESKECELLSSFCHHPLYRTWRQLFRTWSDLETMIMYMIIYDYLQQEYGERYGTRLSHQDTFALLHMIFSDGSLTRQAVEFFRFFQKEDCCLQTCRKRFQQKKKKTQCL